MSPLAVARTAAVSLVALAVVVLGLGRIAAAGAGEVHAHPTMAGCGTITWQLQAGFPEDLRADVEAAAELLGELTGRPVAFVGTEDRRPVNAHRSGPIFLGAGRVADGLLTPGALATAATFADGGVVVGGDIAVDVDQVRGLPAGSGPGGRQLLVLHELGHVLGFDHAAEGLMAERHAPDTQLTDADRAAFAALGCTP